MYAQGIPPSYPIVQNDLVLRLLSRFRALDDLLGFRALRTLGELRAFRELVLLRLGSRN